MGYPLMNRKRARTAGYTRPLFALVLLLAGCVTGVARAGDTVLTFDDIGIGSATVSLGNQYADKGITFENGYAGLGSPARSGAYEAEGIRSGELGTPYIKGNFTNPHHNLITLWVRSQTSVLSMEVRDPGGNLIGQAKTPQGAPAGVWYPLTVEVISRNIASFNVGGFPGGSLVQVDDIRFDDIGSLEGPDFYFYASHDRPILVPGGDPVTVRLYLGRRAGSTGAITPAITRLPSGVSVTFNPNPINGFQVDVTLQAASTAPSTNGQEIVAVARGVPSPSAGIYGTRYTDLPIVVVGRFDMRIVGMEVTQGVQPFDLPQKDPVLVNKYVSYTEPGKAGVRLVRYGKTTVRVFHNLSLAGAIPAYSIRLHGWRYDPANPGARTELEGSPLFPEKYTGVLALGEAGVTDKARQGKEGAIALFDLPWRWTQGFIQLEADIEFPPSFFPPPTFDQSDSNNHFVMTDIGFTSAYGLRVDSVELKVTNPPGLDPLPKPWDALKQASLTTPGSVSSSIWSGTIDITDVWNQTKKACGFLGLGSCDESNEGRSASVVARMQSMARDIKESIRPGIYQIDPLIVGLFPNNTSDQKIRGSTVKSCGGFFWGCEGDPVAIARASDRPLSSVAHEIEHLLGRDHAGGACGASAEKSPFDPWPPDGQGFLNSVGYNWDTDTTIFPDRAGGDPKDYDLMTYCGQNSGDDPDKWISVQGWNQLTNTLMDGFTLGQLPAGMAQLSRPTDPLQGGPLMPGPAAPAPSVASLAASTIAPSQFTSLASLAAAPLSPRLRRTPVASSPSPTGAGPLQAKPPILNVRGFTGADGFINVTQIAPGNPDQPLPSDPKSPYHLIAKDAAGATLADVQMLQALEEVGNIYFLSASVPAASVQSIDIVKDGTPVARRTRSANAPAVTAPVVTPDTIRAGIRYTHVEWQATDADNDPLMTKVDYSADGGATWKPVSFGPNASAADLRDWFFAKSATGKVRVRVNDGFNETTVVSDVYAEPGAPPVVQITRPLTETEIKVGGQVQLVGNAINDEGIPLVGESLKWYVGDTLVGTGEIPVVTDLTVGNHLIRLVGMDAAGRTGNAHVTVRVTP